MEKFLMYSFYISSLASLFFKFFGMNNKTKQEYTWKKMKDLSSQVEMIASCWFSRIFSIDITYFTLVYKNYTNS